MQYSAFVAAILLGRGTVELVENQEPETSIEDSVYFETSQSALEELRPSPEELDVGITEEDGVFVGHEEVWIPVRDPSPTFESIDAESVTVGATPGPSGEFGSRPLMSRGSRYIRVPDDYETIQQAVNQIPIINRHNQVIDIDSGTYSEDVVIPPVIAADVSGQPNGLNTNVQIGGSDGLARVNSVTVVNPSGVVAIGLHDIAPMQLNPYSDEYAVIAVYGGGGQVYMSNLVFDQFIDDLAQGIMAYGGAKVRADDCDFGNGNIRVAFKAKSQGELYVRRASGAVIDYPYSVAGGSINFSESSLSGGQGVAETIRGFIYGADDQILYGVSEIKPGD